MAEPEASFPLPLPWPLRRVTSKKRDISEFFADSSDPPMFSSDDQPATVENYAQPRSKRMRRGPWFDDDIGEQQPKENEVQKRRRRGPLRRLLDSGVWMGSDESQEAEEEEWIMKDIDDYLSDRASSPIDRSFTALSKPEAETDETLLSRLASEYLEDPGFRSGPIFPYWQVQPDDLEAFHKAQMEAYSRVEGHADSTQYCLDLSNLNLRHLMASTLRPLKFLTRDFPASQNKEEIGIYRPIELYLANNQLKHLPGELYSLENATVLTVRSNRLKEISPAICRLVRLRELNIDCNDLHWLPFEFLDLITHDLSRILAVSNPWLRPWDTTMNDLKSEIDHCDTSFPRPLCRTDTAFLTIHGSSIPGWTPAPSSNLQWRALPSRKRSDTESKPLTLKRTPMPSLFELALRTACTSPNLSQLPFFLSASCPATIRQHLQRAWWVKSAGMQYCSVCGKEFLVPRTEWVEWWHCERYRSHDNGLRDAKGTDARILGLNVFPLLRRGCSWACLPTDVDGEHPLRVVEGWTVAE